MTNQNHIISIESRLVGGTAQNTANARELHHYLGVQTKFADWMSRRIEEYGFVEGKDYISTVLKTGKRQNVSKTEYHLSMDMAKELAMVEKTEKGREARQFFIECERRLREELTKQLEAVKPLALPDNTMKHYWMTMNSSGKVLASVELKDSTIVSEKVDEIFPESAVLNRQAVIDDMDAIMGMMHEMTAKVSNRMNRLIPVLGTPTNATQEDDVISDYEKIRQLEQKVWELEQQCISLRCEISNKDDRISELEEQAVEALMHDVEFEVASNWFEQMKFGKSAKDLVQELFREHKFLYEDLAA